MLLAVFAAANLFGDFIWKSWRIRVILELLFFDYILRRYCSEDSYVLNTVRTFSFASIFFFGSI